MKIEIMTFDMELSNALFTDKINTFAKRIKYVLVCKKFF